jgi:hypothetical protein
MSCRFGFSLRAQKRGLFWERIQALGETADTPFVFESVSSAAVLVSMVPRVVHSSYPKMNPSAHGHRSCFKKSWIRACDTENTMRMESTMPTSARRARTDLSGESVRGLADQPVAFLTPVPTTSDNGQWRCEMKTICRWFHHWTLPLCGHRTCLDCGREWPNPWGNMPSACITRPKGITRPEAISSPAEATVAR